MALVLAVERLRATSPHQVLGLAASFGGDLAFLWLGSLVGLLLGLVGLAQRGHRKSLAAWGAVLNGLLFLGPLVGMLLSSAATR